MNDFIKFLGHGIEDTRTCLQAFYPNMKPAAVYINTQEGYDRWIERYNHNAQVYVALNPIREGARQFPKDEDVAYWCNEYIDLDAEKPRELKGYNATDGEIERLKPFVDKINNWLAENGFKAGYNDFTGNGYRWILPVPHLKLDGVNLEKLAAKKKAFKERIVRDCGIAPGCGAAIDSVFDFKRISGVPGTENVKMSVDGRSCRTREPFRGCVRDEDQKLRDYIMLMEIEPTAPQQTPTKQPAGKLEDLAKKDAKLKKLLAGDLCEHVSRSEAELALACKLVYYEFDEIDAGEILVSVPGSKAAEKRRRGHEEYITNAVTKAFAWVSQRKEQKNQAIAQVPQAIPGQYEVVNYELFRKLVTRYPGSEFAAVDGAGAAAVYMITGDDLIKDALELEAITEYIADDGNAIVITDPEQLHAFIGKVEVRLDGENTIYYITVRGQRIEFRADEIIDLSIWRKKAAGYTCKLIISFDLKKYERRDTFDLMIADIMDRAEVIWEEKYSTDDIYAQMIMTEVGKLIMVEDRTSFARNPAAILHEDDVRYVKSATIVSIIERLRIPYGLEKIRIILALYTARSSKQLMIDTRRYSCWVFKEEEKE